MPAICHFLMIILMQSICSEVLEHICPYRDVLDEIRRVLKTGWAAVRHGAARLAGTTLLAPGAGAGRLCLSARRPYSDF